MTSLLTSSLLALTAVITAMQSGASPGGMLVSAAELAAAQNDPSLVILHVAERLAAFEDGHIPGARYIRYGDFAPQIDGLLSELPAPADAKRIFEAAGVSDTSRVVIYGANTVYAARAFFTLDALGHPRVALLDGGLAAWKADGGAVQTGADASTRRGSLTPRLNPARVATAQALQQQAGTGNITLLDIRPDPEFTGSDGGMNGMHAAGHLDGAKQMVWNTLVGPDGRFLPRDQLQAKFASAGAQPGKPVVVYCMVGMRASVAYFVARHLGYDARLYDGSIEDWSRRKLPVKSGRQ